MTLHNSKRLPAMLFWAAAILLPAIFSDPFTTHILIRAATYSIVAMGLALFIGYTGQISLGHAAFFGLAGYCSGILSKYGFPVMSAALIAVVVVAILAFIIALMVLHTKDNYLALASIAVGIMAEVFVKNLDITGGPTGLTNIPSLSIFGYELHDGLPVYYLILFIVAVGLLLLHNLINSRVGDALVAIANNELAAESLGINVFRYKVLSFTLSAVYAAVAGVLFAHYDNFLSPDLLNIKMSILFFVMAFVGGIGSLYGAIIGAVVLTVLAEYTQDFGELNVLIYGVLLAVIIRFLPHGLSSLPTALALRLRHK